MLPVTFGIHKTFLLAPSLRGWVRNQYTATPNAVEEPIAKLPKASNSSKLRAQGMQNTSQQKCFPLPLEAIKHETSIPQRRMPWRSLCEASESLEQQQDSCPRHGKHKAEKMLPVIFGIHKTFLVASTLAARRGPKPVYRTPEQQQDSCQAKCRGGAHANCPNSSRIRAHVRA